MLGYSQELLTLLLTVKGAMAGAQIGTAIGGPLGTIVGGIIGAGAGLATGAYVGGRIEDRLRPLREGMDHAVEVFCQDLNGETKKLKETSTREATGRRDGFVEYVDDVVHGEGITDGVVMGGMAGAYMGTGGHARRWLYRA